jgi:hypothetical protein
MPLSSGLFLRTPDALVSVARYGNPAPGAPDGVNYKFIGSPSVAGVDRVAFFSTLTGPGVDATNDVGLFGSFAGRLYPIIREGDSLDIGDGQPRTVQTLRLRSGGTGANGQPGVFNDDGQIAVSVDFANSTHVIYRASLSTVIPGDANLDGVVDDADFNALYQNLGHPGTDLARGDFNADGRTDFADFQVLELNFGRSIEPLAAPIDPSAVQAFAATVPEPRALGMLLVAITAMLRRRRRQTNPTV